MRRVGWSRLDLILAFHPTAKGQLINFKQYVYVYIYIYTMWKCYVRAMCARFVICASLFPTIHCLFAGSLLAVRPGIGLRRTEETQKQKRRDHIFVSPRVV
jgi:hypothetical protein